MQTLSLVVVTFTYLLVGAAIFDALEGTNNENSLEGLLQAGIIHMKYFSLLIERGREDCPVTFVISFITMLYFKVEIF